MTPWGKRKESNVVNGVLATCVLYFVLDLSSGGRTFVDWAVIAAVALAIAWNVIQLTRLLRVLGGRAVWQVQRTVLFWIIGLMNTVFRAPGDPASWKLVTGVALVGLAAVDTVALYRKERRLLASGSGPTSGTGHGAEAPAAHSEH